MHKTSVLVVEDDPELLEAYRLNIEACGFNFLGLTQAEPLLQEYQTHHPDIILMDIQLPGIDGLKIIEKLRRLPRNELCKVIFISAHEREDYINQAFAVGADDFILKPINWLILTKRLQQLARENENQRRINTLAQAFKNAGEGMLITDTEAHIIEVNDAFCRITGFPAEDVIGHSPAIISSGMHDKNFYQQMWQDLLGNGAWSGEIWNRRKSGEVYPEWLNITAITGQGGQISNFIGVFSDITHIKEQEAQLLKQASHDDLTGLPNRNLLLDRLEQAINRTYRDNRGLAVLFIDLDGFKDINDLHGHDAGDKVLVELAQRYLLILRREDTVARIGGDEFVVILGGIGHLNDARAIADKVLEQTNLPISVGSYSVTVGCSIGIAIQFSEVEDAELLIRYADQAMYRAKHGGKNRIETYMAENYTSR